MTAEPNMHTKHRKNSACNRWSSIHGSTSVIVVYPEVQPVWLLILSHGLFGHSIRDQQNMSKKNQFAKQKKMDLKKIPIQV